MTSASPSPDTSAAGVHTADRQEETLQPVAAILAVLLPGAGHAYLGETKRAMLIAAGVLGMFFGGLLVGGIGVVDKRDNFIWFLGQSLVGPIAFGVDAVHQNYFKVIDRHGPRPARPDEGRGEGGRPVIGGTPPYTRSLGRVNELGTLFATVAGMMNLICIIDAAFHAPPQPRRRRDGGAR